MKKTLKIIGIFLMAIGAIIAIGALIALMLLTPLTTTIMFGGQIFRPSFGDIFMLGLFVAVSGSFIDPLTDSSSLH